MTLTPVLVGIDAILVSVEVTLVARLPSVAITGLPSASVRDTTDRVRSAMEASGIPFPRKRVEVVLGNPTVRKDGTGIDLAVAAAILQAANPSVAFPPHAAFLGELTLGGEVRSVRGATIHARQHPSIPLICSVEMARTVVAVGGRAIGIQTLSQLLDLPPVDLPDKQRVPDPFTGLDFADVKGLPRATLDALADAARTRKTVLLIGPPGCGKSMLAARCPGLMPDMTRQEALDGSSIRDAAGFLSHTQPLSGMRPFRAPHHSISPAGLIGGALLRPGEVNLAHEGVLFLDDVTEFPRHSLEILREPLADGMTKVRRAEGPPVTVPARPWVILAANPCPCGNAGHPTRACTCSTEAVARHHARLEQAIQIFGGEVVRIPLSPVSPAQLLNADNAGATTAELRDAACARTALEPRDPKLYAQS